MNISDRSRSVAHLPLLIIALAVIPSQAEAQKTLAMSGDPGALTVSTATAGFQPDPAIDASTTYAVETDASGLRILARLSDVLPSGLTLTVHLSATGGATSAGHVPLSTDDAEVVTAIPTPGTNGTITYTFSATVSAGPVPTIERTVTFTLVSGP